MSIESVMPSNHLILCHPLLFLPSIFPSIKVFSSESTLHIRWPKYCNFSFSISPSNEYSGLISFRVDWFDLLAVKRTPKRIPRYMWMQTWVQAVPSGYLPVGKWRPSHPCLLGDLWARSSCTQVQCKETHLATRAGGPA